MCGIAGYIGDSNAFRADLYVPKSWDLCSAGGLDGEGKESWPSATLGHRRLAVFDLSAAGKQPMISEDRCIGVTFNGAIYNFRELRADLEKSGHQFHSETDTEVLIHGYGEWGIDHLVDRLRGMFVFGLWDDIHHTLFLVRDRLGVKPLVYAARDGCLTFASTIRAFRHAGIAGTINGQEIAEYLELVT